MSVYGCIYNAFFQKRLLRFLNLECMQRLVLQRKATYTRVFLFIALPVEKACVEAGWLPLKNSLKGMAVLSMKVRPLMRPEDMARKSHGPASTDPCFLVFIAHSQS